MATYKKSFIALISILLLSCSSQKKTNDVFTGSDILVSTKLDLLKGKNLGIITNHTAILKDSTHLVDTLNSLSGFDIKVLFGPEHGIRGDAPDGISITNGTDSKTGLPVASLYGSTREPTPEMLKDVDLLIFDIQDVGARFYTYISTMFYTIKAAAENEIPILILDRPNPIGGVRVDGPILNLDYQTFVGIAEIPIQHGMTVGELAKYFNQKEILGIDKTADLTIIKMKNWKREFYFDDCNLTWVKPSPNMPTLETAIVYPGLCMLEGVNISEGRGTYTPFTLFGSPYLESDKIITEIKKLGISGCELTSKNFIPVSIPKMAYKPKYENENCNGIEIKVTNKTDFRPIEFAVKLLYVLKKIYPEKLEYRVSHFDRLWGSNSLRIMLDEGKNPQEILKSFENDLTKFTAERKKYLLY